MAVQGLILAFMLQTVLQELLVLLTEQNSSFDAFGTSSSGCFED